MSRSSLALLLMIGLHGATFAGIENGAKLYQERCAICHDKPQDHTPPKATLGSQPPDDIFTTLTSGVMRAQGVRLSSVDKADIAHYLSGREIGSESEFAWDENRCTKPVEPLKAKHAALNQTTDNRGGHWTGWGRDLTNSRYQPEPGFNKQDINRLKVKWAFAYPKGRRNAQPVIVGNRVFTGIFPGRVFALDIDTGCTVWSLDTGSGVRNAINVAAGSGQWQDRVVAYFGTNNSYAYAVDANSGEVLWKTQVDEHPVGRVTGATVLHHGVLYVPMSSNEEVAADSIDYGCCSFRGSVTALNASDGSVRWKTYAIDQAPEPTKINSDGAQMFGPAGAAIWSAPTIDVKRNALYVATGDSYTDVVEGGSDAIIAMDLNTGKVLWKNQVTAKDNFVIGCGGSNRHSNCPETMGPDHDFGSSPVLFDLPNGEQVILAGQKSGVFYVLDPDNNGKILWQEKLGRGGAMGGIQWGFANDGDQVYVAVADLFGQPPEAKPGLNALDVVNHRVVWHTPAPKANCEDAGFRCANAFSQAVTAIPGVVFAGSVDGHLRAYAVEDGRVLWDYNARAMSYESVNGLTVKGGSFDGGGPVIANGMMAVNSGYNPVKGQPGNVLLLFTVDGK